MKKKLLIVAVLFLMIRTVQAQNYEQNSFFDQKLKEIIEEKLRPANGSLPENDDIQPLQRSVEATPNETQVVKTLSPESEVHAVINPADSNNIVLSPIKNSSTGMYLPIYYTKDFGKTWNLSSFSPFPKDKRAKILGGGDPNFVFDANGRLYYTWIDLYYTISYSDTTYWGLYYAYSDDGGSSWKQSDSNVICLSTGKISQNYFPEVYDKQWMAVDMTNSPYKNTVYLSYVKLQSVIKKATIVLKKKRPYSNSFDSLDVAVSDASFQEVQFTNITVDGKGHVHIIFWGSKDKISYGIWHSVSTNGGNSFSTPILISNAQKMSSIVGIKASRLYPCTQLVSDQTTSNLYATWTSNGTSTVANSGADIYFSRSVDDGITWSTPYIVNNDDKTGYVKDQFYSSLAVNKLGVITITWYDGRYSASNIGNKDIRYFMAKSKDAGLSFGDNFSVCSSPTDFSTVGLKNSSFGIGEYTQVLTTNSYAIPVWSDGRNNDGNLDIYVAFVKLDSTYTGFSDISVVTDKFRLEQIFPNPASDELNLNISINGSTEIKYTLYDMLGKKVKMISTPKLNAGKYDQKLDLTDLKTGRYVLLIESDFGYISRSVSIFRNFK